MAGQLITGEALYQALLSANPDLAYTWRDLNTYDKDIYIEVATALNGTYLAPLQGLVRDCLRLAKEGTSLQDAGQQFVWEARYDELEALAEESGPALNASIVQLQGGVFALKGLVMQWRQLLQEHDELSVMSLVEIEDWHKHWELLKRRSAELLSEEQKEG